MIDTQQRQQSYQDYLRSEQWQQLRRKVLKRDLHICQGCLAQPASEVHHTTYAHARREFCFELVSLCRDCHARLHGRQP